jgi:hypothetical protein
MSRLAFALAHLLALILVGAVLCGMATCLALLLRS